MCLVNSPWQLSPLAMEEFWRTYRTITSDKTPAYVTGAGLRISVPSCAYSIDPVNGDVLGFAHDDLELVLGKLQEILPEIIDNELQRAGETAFAKKVHKPRNIRVGARYKSRINKLGQPIYIQEPISDSEFSEACRNIAITIGYGRHVGQLSPDVVEPPKQNAASGYTWDGVSERVGRKGALWPQYQRAIKRVMKQIDNDDFLDIKRVLDRDYLRQVCIKYRLAFTTLFRLDGGPDKTRIIFVGSALLYIMEAMFFGCKVGSKHKLASLDVKESPFIASNTKKILNWLKVFRGVKYASEDIREWDLSWWWRYMVLAMLVLCELYQVPPKVAVIIIAYNAMGFVMTEDGLVTVEGRVRSGTGFFPKLNHLLRHVSIYFNYKWGGLITSIEQFEPPIVFGDDSIAEDVPDNDSAHKGMQRRLGLEVKDGAVTSFEGGIMLRRVAHVDKDYTLPMLNSVVRNTLMPEHAISRYRVYDLAMRLRSQLVNIENAMRHEPHWLSAYDFLICYVVDERYTLPHLTDSEVGKMASDKERSDYLRAKKMV